MGSPIGLGPRSLGVNNAHILQIIEASRRPRRAASRELLQSRASSFERPPLSKGFLSGQEMDTSILINGSDWYRNQGIDVSRAIATRGSCTET
jgi:hypothetical protein